MKITAFNGSQRGGSGNTHIMVEEFLKGAAQAGAQTEYILLNKKVIKNCLGCFKCWTQTPGICAVKDDMKELLDKIRSSDIIVFATPVYIDNVTAIMKNFMDRLIPLIDPHIEKDETGEYRHAKRHPRIPKIVVISNSGLPEQSHFQVLSLLFKRIARSMQSEVIAEIYRGAGGILTAPGVFLGLLVKKYKDALYKAGIEIAQNMKLSEETKSELAKPIISHERYVKSVNAHWDKMISRIKICNL